MILILWIYKFKY